MPTIAERTGVDLSGYTPVAPVQSNLASSISQSSEPTLNAFLRCPLPPVWQTTPDSLRQFYQGGRVPQTRLFNPQPNNIGGGTITVNEFATNSSSSGGGTPVVRIAATQTSIVTPPISPNNTFEGVIKLSRSFQLLNVTSNHACRVQLYGNATEQVADSYRGLDVPPPAGTIQNIICDVVLDTSPYQWGFQDRVGSNADTVPSSNVYITVTNLDVATDAFTVTILYVPIATK